MHGIFIQLVLLDSLFWQVIRMFSSLVNFYKLHCAVFQIAGSSQTITDSFEISTSQIISAPFVTNNSKDYRISIAITWKLICVMQSLLVQDVTENSSENIKWNIMQEVVMVPVSINVGHAIACTPPEKNLCIIWSKSMTFMS